MDRFFAWLQEIPPLLGQYPHQVMLGRTMLVLLAIVAVVYAVAMIRR
ncbi:MAG TPA: hypothetical protein VMU69_02020 [Bradyrhizobium sp.]|nr:hypothetical protein [Bradyrhizobium sp.]